MIYKLLSLVAYGYTLHRLTYKFTMQFGDKLSNLLRLTIGTLALMPAKAFIWREIRPSIIDCANIDDLDHRLFTAEILAAGATGAGVMLGHLFDKDNQTDDDEI